MEIAPRFRDRRLWLMVGLGFATGVVSAQLYQLEPLWRELSVGIAFGVVIGACLFVLRLTDPPRAAAFAVLTVAAWWLAERATIQVFGVMDEADFLSWAGLVGGVTGGLVGAALLAAASALLFPWFRRPVLLGLSVGLGGLLGAALALIDFTDSALILFPPWQAAIAGCLALGFPNEAADAAGSEPPGG